MNEDGGRRNWRKGKMRRLRVCRCYGSRGGGGCGWIAVCLGGGSHGRGGVLEFLARSLERDGGIEREGAAFHHSLLACAVRLYEYVVMGRGFRWL